MPINFKSKLSSAVANATFLDKTIDDATVGAIALNSPLPASGNSISNTQGYINEIATASGIDFFGDPNGNVYSSENYIDNGDSRKVAIGKLDAEAAIRQSATETNATNITAINDSIGVADGICPLDSSTKIDISYIPDAILGAMIYQGTWDADTNTPALASGVGTKGYYYIVNVAGTTNLDGISDWQVGDYAVYNGTAWEQIDNTDAVLSVNGQTGAVVLDKTNIGLTNVTDDAQLKRAAGDMNTFAEKVIPVDDDIVLIEDSEDTFNKKKVKLSNMLGGGGAGGGSFVWEENGNASPTTSILKGMSLYDFDDSSSQEIYALVTVPDSYTDGNQITLENSKFFANAASGNVLFRCDTSLLKDNDDVTGVLNGHTSINTEILLNTLNAVRDNGTIDLTDAIGEISSIAVAAGDTLIVRLYRDNVNETSSATTDARFLKFSASISFGG